MRKDVECTFGILKGRWRILKTGVRLHDTASVDKIWLTCCALHNMLLEVDGLDKEWDGVGVPTSAYLGELGEVEGADLPEAIRRALNPSEIRQYDTTSVGAKSNRQGWDHEEDNSESDTDSSGGEDESSNDVRHVRKLSLPFFRQKLVEHFTIKFRRNEVKWPRSRGADSVPRLSFDS